MIDKPAAKLPNVHFLIYSNENTLPIVELSLKYFEKHFGLDNIKISVASNRYLTDDLPFKDKVNYINANVDFTTDGFHFREIIAKAVDSIEEQFIFYFCEDYINIKPVDWDSFSKLVCLLDNENIDLFTFSSFQPEKFNLYNTPGTFKLFEKNEKYGFKEKDIYYVGEEQIHRYSLQPGIWKKDCLKEILKYNPYMKLHYLDSSHISGKKGTYRDRKLDPFQQYIPWSDPEERYDHKVLTCSHMIFDYYPHAGQQFVISYLELIRNGKISFHGSDVLNQIDEHNWVRKEINKIVEENNLYNDRRYDKFLGNGKIYF